MRLRVLRTEREMPLSLRRPLLLAVLRGEKLGERVLEDPSRLRDGDMFRGVWGGLWYGFA